MKRTQFLSQTQPRRDDVMRMCNTMPATRAWRDRGVVQGVPCRGWPLWPPPRAHHAPAAACLSHRRLLPSRGASRHAVWWPVQGQSAGSAWMSPQVHGRVRGCGCVDAWVCGRAGKWGCLQVGGGGSAGGREGGSVYGCECGRASITAAVLAEGARMHSSSGQVCFTSYVRAKHTTARIKPVRRRTASARRA